MFQWRTAEYDLIEKEIDWFVAVSVISIALAISAFLFSNILFGIFIIVAAVALMIQGAREPDVLDVLVDRNGVTISEHFFPYKNLDAFWIEYETQLLFIRTKKILSPHIVLPITSVDSDELAEFLVEHLKEEEMEESLLHKLLEYLGF